MQKILTIASVLFLSFHLAHTTAHAKPASSSGRADITGRTGMPYLGAITVDADTGEVVFEENADAKCYPASIVKLMDLLLIMEKIEQGSLKLDDKVSVTANASRMGGSQVYLKEGEVFTVEELLYALMVQSANDAAVALAIHVAGSTDAFVKMMQERANTLGMKETTFHTVHGLPPARDQEPDISSPRDLVLLAREVLKYPNALRYTSTRVRGFRNDTYEMRNHNRLLGDVRGCDGLKTGYFRRGGYSVAATAERDGNRFIAVVTGSKEKKVRDAKARELLSSAFANAQAKPTPVPTPATVASQSQAAQQSAPAEKPFKSRGAGKRIFITIIMVVATGVVVYMVWFRKGNPPPPGVYYRLE
jgi:D-alanyl-D-alanine carboxypeptidase (penicillin-binding protein 5/6)